MVKKIKEKYKREKKMEIITGDRVQWTGMKGVNYAGTVTENKDGLMWIQIGDRSKALVPTEAVYKIGDSGCQENFKEEIMDDEKKDQETTEETALAPEETSAAEETAPEETQVAEESNVVTAESLKKRKNYGRKKWTLEDGEKLLAMYKEGKKRPEMCEAFDVKDGAIRSRLYWFKITGKLN